MSKVGSNERAQPNNSYTNNQNMFKGLGVELELFFNLLVVIVKFT